MLRVAIVDDMPQFCVELQNMMEQYAESNGKELEIYAFHSGEEFCNYWQNHHEFELVFLDIELLNMNGIDVGAYLREYERNEAVQIIFVSAKESYAMKLFQHRPFDFLVKPVTYKNFSLCLERYFKLYQNSKQYFQYFSNRKKLAIATDQIIYFESKAKKIEMNTIGGRIVFYGKLDEVEHEVTGELFLRIHQSFLVNTTYITDFRFDAVTLSDGSVLQISRIHQESVRAKLMYNQHAKMKGGLQSESK